jgi:hypothetical protein
MPQIGVPRSVRRGSRVRQGRAVMRKGREGASLHCQSTTAADPFRRVHCWECVALCPAREPPIMVVPVGLRRDCTIPGWSAGVWPPESRFSFLAWPATRRSTASGARIYQNKFICKHAVLPKASEQGASYSRSAVTGETPSPTGRVSGASFVGTKLPERSQTDNH